MHKINCHAISNIFTVCFCWTGQECRSNQMFKTHCPMNWMKRKCWEQLVQLGRQGNTMNEKIILSRFGSLWSQHVMWKTIKIRIAFGLILWLFIVTVGTIVCIGPALRPWAPTTKGATVEAVSTIAMCWCVSCYLDFACYDFVLWIDKMRKAGPISRRNGLWQTLLLVACSTVKSTIKLCLQRLWKGNLWWRESWH